MPTQQMTWRTRRRRNRPAVPRVLVVLAAALVVAHGAAASVYDGHLTLPSGQLGGATGTLGATGRRVAGTLSLAAGSTLASGDYAVTGRQAGKRLVVAGLSSAGTKLSWSGRRRTGATFEGVLRLRWPGGRMRGRLALAERASDSSACDDYFRGQVMARVLLPVCAACHVAGGAAAATRLSVVADDPVGTRNAVAALIDAADPPSSLLLQKPVGGLAHGGGAQLAPAGAEIQILEHWVELVTTAQCAGAGPPGGGGGSPGATLYGDSCASCHGSDARGADTRPAVLCNRDVHDPVRWGRNASTGQSLMPPFPRLTDADIDLLQGYLDGLCPTATATGADLFTGNCAVCHGTDARGGTAPDVHCNRAVGDIVRDGVVGVFGPMPALMRVTDPEIQRIQDHLNGLCPSGAATGAELFAGNCAGCHGTSGQGDGARRPDIRCSVPSRVTNAVRKGRGVAVPVMPSWSSAALTDAELTSVMAFVGPSCGGQPANLFASNCATCHGAAGTGGQNANGLAGPNIRCATQAKVLDAVGSGFGGMPALPDLTGAPLTAIVSFVRSGCP